jgi:sialic acid synthase SpsE
MENIWVKRPGTGDIPARDFKKILGARATRDIKANTFLKNDDVEGWRV